MKVHLGLFVGDLPAIDSLVADASSGGVAAGDGCPCCSLEKTTIGGDPFSLERCFLVQILGPGL